MTLANRVLGALSYPIRLVEVAVSALVLIEMEDLTCQIGIITAVACLMVVDWSALFLTTCSAPVRPEIATARLEKRERSRP